MFERFKNLNKLELLAGGVVILLFIVALILWFTHPSAPTGPSDSGSYKDTNSGETVSNPNGKAPDTFGQPS